ncbi:MAG TPA: VWA domain-containing protein [Vicinamibacterales bacterium]|jgi:VWFA-related protein
MKLSLPRVLSVTTVVAVATSPWLGAQQQEPQRPVFRAEVVQLRIDVQVVANDGLPIPNLEIGDFKVAIDGHPRRIVSAELVQYSEPPTDGAAPVVPIRTPGRVPEDSRLYILAIDQAAFSSGALMAVRPAIRRFIDQLRPEDMVGLYDFPFREPLMNLTHDHSEVTRAFARLVGMREPPASTFNLSPSEVVDITALDADTLNRVVARECDLTDPFCASMVRQEASAIAGMAETEAQQRLRSLGNLVRGLSRIPGRKTVVLVSGGMLSSTRVGGRPDVSGLISQLGELATAADANFYVLHWDSSYMETYSAAASRPGRNYVDRFQTMFADRHALGQGLEWLAGKAGGALLRVEAGIGDYAFDRVLRETAAYYLLGVEPADEDRDGKMHFLRVEVSRRGATVRNRTHVLVPRRGTS